jgi:hypothetical protein
VTLLAQQVPTYQGANVEICSRHAVRPREHGGPRQDTTRDTMDWNGVREVTLKARLKAGEKK